MPQCARHGCGLRTCAGQARLRMCRPRVVVAHAAAVGDTAAEGFSLFGRWLQAARTGRVERTRAHGRVAEMSAVM